MLGEAVYEPLDEHGSARVRWADDADELHERICVPYGRINSGARNRIDRQCRVAGTPIIANMDEFSHVDDDQVQMVDVGDKDAVDRRAVAAGALTVQPTTAAAIREGDVEKGNVLATARVAAIQAVKRTWDDLPLCHQIAIGGVTVEFEVGEEQITCEVEVRSTGQTGVEMEALNGVTRALLTVFDMVKSAEKDDDGEYPEARIGDVRVVEKTKGASS